MIPEQDKSKIIPFQNRKNINIGIIMFSIIFIYLIATIIMYITAPHVTVYEVRQGSILKDNAYTGLAIREEEVVYADTSGYANYYVENNSKIRVGTKIYTISDKKLVFQESNEANENALSSSETSTFYLKLHDYNNQFVESKYADTYQVKNELTSTLDKSINKSKAKKLETLLAEGNSSILNVKSASRDGVFVCAVDGMENIKAEEVTSQLLSKENYKRTDFHDNQKIAEGSPIYKLVTSDKWSLFVEVSEETRDMLLEKTSIKVNFKKDNQELRAQLSFLENTEKPIIRLQFNHSMIRYVNERYLDIELILEDQTGLKIPKSAETSKYFYVIPKDYLTQGGNSNSDGVLVQSKNKSNETITQFLQVTVYFEEDDRIYLDPNVFEEAAILVKPNSSETLQLKEKKSLKGVYCINKGYAVFKQIQILCESDEYYIIKEGNSFGLSNYDHIALDGKNINENDVVF